MHYKTLETGISDYHKLVITITKTSYNKGKPIISLIIVATNILMKTFKQELSFQLQTFSSLDNNLPYFPVYKSTF